MHKETDIFRVRVRCAPRFWLRAEKEVVGRD